MPLSRARSASLLALRLLELFTLFLLLPALLYFHVISPRYRLLVLFSLTAALLLYLFLANIPRSRLGLAKPLLRPALLTLLHGLLYLALPFLLLLAYHCAVHLPLFAPPHGDLRLFTRICLIYPLSAAAQELIYRAFFFHRYNKLLPPKSLLILNALLFGLLHLIYGHPIAILLTTALGLILAHLYTRHHSLPGVFLLHLLAGMTMFSTGYWRWFYIDTVR
jgi:membrane protease YdiL (CAAX protease family)